MRLRGDVSMGEEMMRIVRVDTGQQELKRFKVTTEIERKTSTDAYTDEPE